MILFHDDTKSGRGSVDQEGLIDARPAASRQFDRSIGVAASQADARSR